MYHLFRCTETCK
ncbi:hypothetical protein ACMD2_26094 [Ananas comosus]|uniref:Uncharacterized protein n=1 Tax=Ananas comosus TaxID=4615 RepID=A0A199UPR4_ANACO|nr:hypothetical protein ACMD2_26094 [Ananas comosus]